MPEPKVGSPEWWRDRLLAKLDEQAKRVAQLEKYHAGDHPLPTPPQRMNEVVFQEAKQAFQTLSKLGRTNLMPLVASAPADRLSIRGFRFGETIGDDKVAWKIWQRNHMDAEVRLLIDTAMVCGNGYTLVWADDDGKATITCEHPSQMIVAYAAGSRRQRVAALKRWLEDDGRLMCTLYLPDALYKWQTASRRPEFGQALGFGNTWEVRQPVGEEWPLPNPWGKVTVVEWAVNTGLKARPFGGGVGEFEVGLTVQDRINKGVFDRLATGEAQAFRQRYSIGWVPPIDPETKQPDPRATLRASQASLMAFPKDVTVGEFGQADFTGFLRSFESDVAILATMTKTPQSYLPLDLKNLGAETIAMTTIGFNAKTTRHRDGLGESGEETISLALEIEGDNRAQDVQSQVLWEGIEVHTLGEIVDAAVKLKSLDVPVEALWAMLPADIASQQDINLWKQLARAAELLAPAPPVPPAPVVTGAA